MIGNMTRVKAAAMAKGAQIALVAGVAGAAYLLWAETPAPPSTDDRQVGIADHGKNPAASPPKAPVQQAMDPKGVGDRLAAISNVPKAPEPPPHFDDPSPTPPEDPEKTEEPIKYVGPVKIPGSLLAVLSIDGKQRTAGKGKSVSYKVEDTAHAAQIVEVGDDSITVSENGKERVIAKAASDGEIVSYLGDKPQRSPSPMASKQPGKNAKIGFEMGGAKANAARAAKNAAANRASDIMAAKIKTMQDAGEKVNPELMMEMEKLNREALQESIRIQKAVNREKE